MDEHRIPGYEVFFRCLKTEEGYAEIVRWEGPLGKWTSLCRKNGPEFGVKDGDSEEDVAYIAEKIAGLRVFADAERRMNLSPDLRTC